MNFVIIQGKVVKEGKYSFIYYRKNINNKVLKRKYNKISIKKYKREIINEYRKKENNRIEK
jgi:hypothetical protein